MTTGAHFLFYRFYRNDSGADRAFIRDVLALRSVDLSDTGG